MKTTMILLLVASASSCGGSVEISDGVFAGVSFGDSAETFDEDAGPEHGGDSAVDPPTEPPCYGPDCCQEVHAVHHDAASWLGCVTTVPMCPYMQEWLTGTTWETCEHGAVDACSTSLNSAADCAALKYALEHDCAVLLEEGCSQ